MRGPHKQSESEIADSRGIGMHGRRLYSLPRPSQRCRSVSRVSVCNCSSVSSVGRSDVPSLFVFQVSRNVVWRPSSSLV